MKKIKSHKDAYEVAESIVERMDIGQTVHGNAIEITKTDDGRVSVIGSEYNYDQASRYGHSPQKPKEFYSVELADFVLYPERRRVNDALEVIEDQLTVFEAELFARLF